MFDKARELVLTDRTRARRALTDEIKRLDKEELEAELDQLETEEQERLNTEKAEAARVWRTAEVRLQLQVIREQQHEAAATFDAAVLAAN